MELDTSLQSAPAPEAQSPQTESIQTPEQSNTQDLQQQIHEIDKFQRFKFKGQEYTPKDLEAAMLRQKDYTEKTQKLAQERKAFEAKIKEAEEDQKFQSNLQADLEFIKKNPQHAAKFLEVYPKKYHQYLQRTLQELNQAQTQGPQAPNYEVLQAMKRLETLESFYNQQEVAKNELEINQKLESFSKKYPDADVEKCLARLNEMQMQMTKQDESAQLSEENWEQVFKAVEEAEQQKWKSKYSTLVKKQLDANSKAKDVDAGGASVGRAPPKFKNLSDVTKYAAQSLSKRS